ncbi:uncharacterized protein [Arachis hypogaea]|uniref:uncharacterized protein isoform X1 n=1 Tax=Arachis hypogaea TaxID=3818 RepID=UPI000DEC6806|nr:uncharacterized protein LOC112707783 isoform X1 [Arachis hypogaea]
MASISGSRSGGKILRSRRRAATSRTPYDRPAPPPPSASAAPPSANWLSRYVLSPTRFIASGTGKFFSAVFDLDSSSPTSSSSDESSPCSSAAGSSSEDVGAFDDEIDNTVEGDDALNKGLQPLVASSESKLVIEQLLMKESFSREEGDRLIKIIRSRVVDFPVNDDDEDKGSRDIASPELCSAAVLEAKKWLQEKKSGLESNSDLGYGIRSLDLVTLTQVPTDEGSPVDVAKSYMRSRPPWASPSLDHIKPPTPVGIQLFKEQTPHLFGGNSTSSSKVHLLKRDTPATGSWSIQDELRRVRSRATEEMLRTVPSSKIDLSPFPMGNTNNVHTSAIENIKVSSGEKAHNFTNVEYPLSNLASGISGEASPGLESKLNGSLPECFPSDLANINSDQKQGFGAVQQSKGSQDGYGEITTSGKGDGSLNDVHRDGGLVYIDATNDTNGDNHQLDSGLKSSLHDENGSVIKEKVVVEAALPNGNSGPRIHAGQVIEQNRETLDNEPSTVYSRQEETTAQRVLERDNCKVLSESIEIPDSQNSSSIQYEVQEDNNLPGSEANLEATQSSIAKRKGKRVTRSNTRGGWAKGVK